jgi:MPBQ/MSBQ methyltransferase
MSHLGHTFSTRPHGRIASAITARTPGPPVSGRKHVACELRNSVPAFAKSSAHEVTWSGADALEASTVARPMADIAVSAGPSASAAAEGPLLPTLPTAALVLGGLALAGYGIKKVLDTPSRTYDNNVGQEYDSWTDEGVLEYYWGEHIHLGYYTPEERAAGYKKKDFIGAKHDFVEQMLQWSGAKAGSGPAKILDVGCGIGGTSRILAASFPDAKVTGITLSPKQVNRGTQLAQERGLPNVDFQVMNALHMDFPDDTFDLVWACESGEHMPDKESYVKEMVRVLKPGGTLVLATWCQRDETPEMPLTDNDRERLQFLYDEWAHPYFVSKEEYGRIAARNGLENVVLADWTAPTIPSWRHSVWVGVYDPWIVVFKGPRIWYKTVREIVTLERMHRAFADGLMEYGMMKAMKAAKPAVAAGSVSGSAAAAAPYKIEIAP